MNREKYVESIISILPYIFKKFKKVFQVVDMPRQQLELLFKMNKLDGRPASEYSEMMMIPKSNITVASNKLVQAGFVKRDYDISDRRVIILKITDKGREYLSLYMEEVKAAMLVKLTDYADQDLERMDQLIEELKTLIDKVKD